MFCLYSQGVEEIKPVIRYLHELKFIADLEHKERKDHVTQLILLDHSDHMLADLLHLDELSVNIKGEFFFFALFRGSSLL